MRGDGPFELKALREEVLFSPHAWGWSGRHGGGLGIWRSFPHMRGDGPGVVETTLRKTVFSPHAWGWFAQRLFITSGDVVFPS